MKTLGLLIGIVFISYQAEAGSVFYLPLGCYKEIPDNPDLDGKIVTPPTNVNMTWAWCAKECADDGFAYAGIQSAETCHCGDTYAKHGWSAGCRQQECSIPDPADENKIIKQACGGTNANYVLYAVDSDPLARMDRTNVAHSSLLNFTAARHHCIAEGGDLPVVVAKEFVTGEYSVAWATQQVTVTTVREFWVGLTHKEGDTDFSWVDPTSSGMAGTELWLMWSNPTSQDRCVVLFDEGGGEYKFKKIPCTEQRPFLCKQLPISELNGNGSSTASPDEEASDWLKANAALIIYIVLPIFFFVFIGSCVIYIIGKSYRYCKAAQYDDDNFSNLGDVDKDGRPLTSRDVAVESGSPPPPYYRAASRGRKADEQPLVPTYNNESETKRYPGRAKVYAHEQEEPVPNEFAIDFSKLSIQDIIYIKSLMGERRPTPPPPPGKKKRKIIMA